MIGQKQSPKLKDSSIACSMFLVFCNVAARPHTSHISLHDFGLTYFHPQSVIAHGQLQFNGELQWSTAWILKSIVGFVLISSHAVGIEKVMCYDMRYDHYLPFIPYSIRIRDIALVPNTFVYTIWDPLNTIRLSGDFYIVQWIDFHQTSSYCVEGLERDVRAWARLLNLWLLRTYQMIFHLIISRRIWVKSQCERMR